MQTCLINSHVKKKKKVPDSTLLQAVLQTTIFVFTVSMSSPLFSLPSTLFSWDPYFSTATALVLVASDLALSNGLFAVLILPLSSLEKILPSFLKHFFLGLRTSYTSLLHGSFLCILFLFPWFALPPQGILQALHFTWMLMTLPNLYFQPCSLSWGPDLYTHPLTYYHHLNGQWEF